MRRSTLLSLPLQLVYPDLVRGNNPICHQTTQGGKVSDDPCCYCGHAISKTIQLTLTIL
jgi:hypothetical protein